MECKLQILNGSIKYCVKKIVEKKQISKAIVGPTVYSMNCFSPIYSYLHKNKIPIIIPNYPLIL